ncbi:MAG: hypothetical protein ACI8RD_000949 [Bacillariaceae sp.]|jgi:hypothetical protein
MICFCFDEHIRTYFIADADAVHVVVVVVAAAAAAAVLFSS